MEAEKKKIYKNLENSMLGIFKNKLVISQNEFDSITFVSMFIYHCEKAIGEICSDIIKKESSNFITNEMLDYIFEDLTFTSKINIYEKLLRKYPKQYADLIRGISFYRNLNKVRNDIFHCKIKKVAYRGKSIMLGETKHLMIKDMIKSIGGKK